MLDASFMKRLTQTEAVYVYSIGLMMSQRIGTIAEIARKLVSRGKIMKKHFENRQCIISSSIFLLVQRIRCVAVKIALRLIEKMLHRNIVEIIR